MPSGQRRGRWSGVPLEDRQALRRDELIAAGVHLLGGESGPAVTVRASTGNWDQKRPTEGAYAAHIQFANGAFAEADIVIAADGIHSELRPFVFPSSQPTSASIDAP